MNNNIKSTIDDNFMQKVNEIKLKNTKSRMQSNYNKINNSDNIDVITSIPPVNINSLDVGDALNLGVKRNEDNTLNITPVNIGPYAQS